MESKTPYTKQLIYSYRQINDVWRRYDPIKAFALAQQSNMYFAQNMRKETEKMESEIEALYLQEGSNIEKVWLLLSDLSQAVNDNVEIYQEKESIFNSVDFQQMANTLGIDEEFYQLDLYRLIYEHSQTVLGFTNKFTVTDTNTRSMSETNGVLKFIEQYDIVLYFFYSGIYNAILENSKSSESAAEVIATLAGIPGKGGSLRPLFSNVAKFDSKIEKSRKLYNLNSVNRVIDMLTEANLLKAAEELRQVKERITPY